LVRELPVSTGTLDGHFFLIILGALVWVIGGNLIIARHFKRRGMAADEGLKLGGLLKVSLNAGEMVALLGAGAIGLALVAFGAGHL
jgi:hypothetical protein